MGMVARGAAGRDAGWRCTVDGRGERGRFHGQRRRCGGHGHGRGLGHDVAAHLAVGGHQPPGQAARQPHVDVEAAGPSRWQRRGVRGVERGGRRLVLHRRSPLHRRHRTQQLHHRRRAAAGPVPGHHGAERAQREHRAAAAGHLRRHPRRAAAAGLGRRPDALRRADRAGGDGGLRQPPVPGHHARPAAPAGRGQAPRRGRGPEDARHRRDPRRRGQGTGGPGRAAGQLRPPSWSPTTAPSRGSGRAAHGSAGWNWRSTAASGRMPGRASSRASGAVRR